MLHVCTNKMKQTSFQLSDPDHIKCNFSA